MAASQIACKCTACFCIWTCLLLHQSVYCHGADVVRWEFEHRGLLLFQKMGLSGFLLKMFGLWLSCRMLCIIPLISGMVSTSIRYSHYRSGTLLLLLTFSHCRYSPILCMDPILPHMKRKMKMFWHFWHPFRISLNMCIGTLK